MNKKLISMALVGSVMIGLTGRAKATDSMTLGIGDEPLVPVDDYYGGAGVTYTDEGVVEEATATYVSDDGLCEIAVMPDYYDVTLYYENGSRYDVGAAYGRTIPQAMPEFESVMEPYLYGTIRMMYGGTYTPEAVEDRVLTLYDSMRDEFKEELAGLADALSEGRHGFTEDGLFSYEEVIAL
ncbi:MAG: hypothetical protein IKH76_00070, partial [Clostridiales bacterium]|nr:hypothetical protein [Clostridiales bacterium]